MKKSICLLMILALLFTGAAFTAGAAEEDGTSLKPVRVGYYDLKNCMEVTKDGSRRYGFTRDLLGEIAMVSKWDMEFVDGNFADLMKMLEKGEIDVLPNVVYTQERGEKILFNGITAVEENTFLFALPEKGAAIKAPGDLNGARVATLAGSVQDELLTEWEEENGVKTEHVFFESFAEAWEALDNGTADYTANLDYIAPRNAYVSLFDLGIDYSYFAVTPEREDLVTDIDYALWDISQTSPYLIENLKEEYLKRGVSTAVLTEEEQAWLEAHPVIKIGAFTNDFPYSFIDENGNRVGAYRNLSEMIFRELGLETEYEWILFDTVQQAHEALLKGEIDIFCEDYHDYDTADKNGLIVSNPINEVTMGLMSLADRAVPNRKIAVADTRLGAYYAREAYPDSELILCASVPECIEKVADGEAGYCIAHTSVLHQFSSGYERVFSMTSLNFRCIVCYTAAKTDPEIITILNRGLNLIPQNERNDMELKYNSTETSGGYLLKNFLRDNLWLVITVGAVLLVIVVFAVNRARYSKKLKADLEEITRLRDEQQKNEELLAAALDQAQAASRAKTTFLNNMSHDIRTPMNAIIGYTGLASGHIDNKEQVRDYLFKIGQSSEHLLSLINDVLDMSRIESGKVKIDEKDEDLAEILHTLRNIVQADINAKQLDFFMDTDVTDQFIVCDKLRLNQVLLNIVSNSIKYTQAGGMVSVRVKETGVTDPGCGDYEFRIRDNGMGMSEEFLKTIFDPFTRAKSSTVSGIQGTGLGMAITKNIVDMMNGTIGITSKEGEGTETVLRFSFRLAKKKSELVSIAELEGLKSLVVDDDISACRNIAKMLRDVGMRSEWCVSGKEAVVRTEDALSIGDLFKVYIIDWMMPDMNGIETARRIRQVVGDSAPIIALTAYDWSDIETEAKEAGVTAFVSKPLFPSDLRNVLNKCCVTESGGAEQKEKAPDFAGKKILLVEDNEMNREIAQEILEEEGFILDTAEDGTVAVEKMKKAKPGQYDLILMDVQMPIMNGYEATRAIRALPDKEKADITIIAMTANAFEEDKQEALRAGMNAHLAKPIDCVRLKEMLAGFLKQ